MPVNASQAASIDPQQMEDVSDRAVTVVALRRESEPMRRERCAHLLLGEARRTSAATAQHHSDQRSDPSTTHTRTIRLRLSERAENRDALSERAAAEPGPGFRL